MATSLAPSLSTEAGGGERSRLVPDAGLEETEDTEDNTTFSVMLSSENHSSDVERELNVVSHQLKT